MFGRVKNTLRGQVQRRGTQWMKSLLWDAEYAGGKWDCCDATPGDNIYHYLEKYCNRGKILDLGCGSGNTGTELAQDCYSQYTGVDVSEIAIKKAARRSRQCGRRNLNEYSQSDIVAYTPQGKYDVILFRESIYYIPRPKVAATLARFRLHLFPTGVFIVTVYSRVNFGWIVRLIQEHYTVLETYGPASSPEAFLVFR
jgi:2-polyprenyl-3-methyl-5-hydroxy-6-metoxy-1,4-benzoquinol methylase